MARRLFNIYRLFIENHLKYRGFFDIIIKKMPDGRAERWSNYNVKNKSLDQARMDRDGNSIAVHTGNGGDSLRGKRNLYESACQ